MIISFYYTGHEIAVHTKTHRSSISYWKKAPYTDLFKEIVEVRELMESKGIKNVVGYRNPYLQTAGDTLFTLLKDYNFKYDSSLPTAPHAYWWPYTFDHAVPYCSIKPCPKSKFVGSLFASCYLFIASQKTN